MGLIRRPPPQAAVEVALAITVFLFACGSSSVHALAAIGSPARWGALLVLCGLSLACALANGRRPSRLPLGWLLAAALVAAATVSAAWSVNPRLTIERVFTLGLLLVTAVALALASPEPQLAATWIFRGVLGGMAAVAIGSLLVLAVSHHDAVLSATAGAGWRFRGLGENPNTVPMLLAVGLPLAVWLGLDGSGRQRLVAVLLVLLFSGEIAVSGSRGAIVAGFGGALLTALVLGPRLGAKLALAAGLVVLAVLCLQTTRVQHPAEQTAAASARVSAAPVPTRGLDAQLVLRLEDELGHPALGGYRPPVARTLLGSSGRAQAWSEAVHQAAGRPLLGYGFGTEDRVFVDRSYAFEGGFPENSYLGTLLQLGVVGVALLAGLLVTLALNALGELRRTSARTAAAAAAGVLLVAILIGLSQSGITSVGNIAVGSIWVCVLTLPAFAIGRGVA